LHKKEKQHAPTKKEKKKIIAKRNSRMSRGLHPC
jgi:hypothetical protein